MDRFQGLYLKLPDCFIPGTAQAPIEYILMIDLPNDFTIWPESLSS